MAEFVDFKRCLVELGDQQIYATSASISMSYSTARDQRLDAFDSKSGGSSVGDPTLVADAPAQGKLSFDFVIDDDHFPGGDNPVKTIFDISKTMSDGFIPMGRIGPYRFWHAAITNFSFTMAPFQLIKAKAQYDIFGTIFEIGNKDLPVAPDINPAESLKGFGEIHASGVDLQSEGTNFDIRMLTAEFSQSVNRTLNYTIRANEHPSSQLYPGAILPYRAALKDIEYTCNIKSNKIINYINQDGVIQMRGEKGVPENISVQLYLHGAKKEAIAVPYCSDGTVGVTETECTTGGGTWVDSEAPLIAQFACIGKVTEQALSVSEGGYLSGGFSVKQIIK
jgi:hypothetical protein